MPTGTCRFPQHHGPSAGPPVGLVVALIAGALIIAEWRTVVIVLAVCAALAVAAGLMVMLVHSHRAEPYDGAWAGQDPAQAVVSPAVNVHLERKYQELLELVLAERPAIEAPQQHLHLHGVTAEDIAAALAHQQRHQAAAPLPSPQVTKVHQEDHTSRVWPPE